MKSLTIDDGGVWRVSTEASAYLLDLNNGLGVRLPGEGLGVHPDDAENRMVVTLPLWSDGSTLHLDALYCVVGEPMRIAHDDGGWIVSTLVRKIELVEE